MRRHWMIAGVMVAMLAAGAGSAQSCKVTESDKTSVAETLRAMYAAATVDDMARLHAVVAPGFYAFDGGVRYGSIDELMGAVKGFQDKGVKFVWRVTEPEVTVVCDEAWITYVNDGSIQMPDGSAPARVKWLESAVLERRGGVWRIVFFHSTRVPGDAGSH
jgi:hypothetical protein